MQSYRSLEPILDLTQRRFRVSREVKRTQPLGKRFLLSQYPLGITLRNESRLIPFDRTIRIAFDLENPFIFKSLTPSRKVHQVLDLVYPPRLYPPLSLLLSLYKH